MKTINNKPTTVNTPSGSDIKNYFFNHANWNGISDNKNHLTVDQETFESAKNIYVDEEGVLSSRPSIKLLNSFGLSNILNSWSFAEINVYLTIANDEYYLNFVKDKTILRTEPCSENVFLILSNKKVFVFEESAFSYYDVVNNGYHSAEEFIYVPIVNTVTEGIEGEGESPNEFTSSYIKRYIFTNVNSIQSIELIDKEVTIRVGDKAWKTIFAEATSNIIVSPKFKLNDNNYCGDALYGPFADPKTPLISISDRGTILLSSLDITLGTVENNYIPTLNWHIYYSVDGIVFSEIQVTDGILTTPQISKDGRCAIVFKKDGPYALSLLADSGEDGELYYEYTSWTPIFTERETNPYDLNVPLDMSTVSSYNEEWFFNQNTVIAGYFLSDTTYAFVYGYGTGTVPSFVHSTHNHHISHYGLRLVLYVDGEEKLFNAFEYVSGYTDVSPDTPLVKMVHDTDDTMMAVEYSKYLSSVDDGDDLGKWYMAFSLLNDNVTASYHVNTSYDLYRASVNSDYDLISRYDIRIIDYIQNSAPNIALFRTKYDTLWGGTIVQSWDIDNIGPGQVFLRSTTNKNDISFMAITGQSTRLYTNNGSEYIEFDDNYKPLYSTPQYNYLLIDDTVYSNNLTKETVYIDTLVNGETKYFVPESACELNEYFVSNDNELRISSHKEDDEHDILWYFPKIATQKFNSVISNLHPISKTQVGIFFEDEIWYVENTQYGYSYYRSKLQVGCKNGNDVITSFDGKNIIFSSTRGLVAMSYEDFVSSTEQTLTYLSDTIFGLYDKFNKDIVKLFQYKFWIICYHTTNGNAYVFDMRNNSWWYMSYTDGVQNIIIVNDKPELLSDGNLYYLDTSGIDYKDDTGNIDWYFTSQKLHLNALNYYKKILNITINSLQKDDNSSRVKLSVTNYRHKVFDGKDEVIDYIVDVIRTYVKRVNYSKVIEFQYTISNDETDAEQQPLYISNLSIKYKISNEVR